MVFASIDAKAADIRVLASVDTSRDIYAGDQFTYQIIIDGHDQPGQIDISPLAKFNPRSGGGGNNSQTSISIVNGRTTTTVVKQYIMNYTLTALNQPGPMHIPAVNVTVNGTQFQTNEVVLTIAQPGTTDQIELEVTLSKDKCYAGQPIIMTVKFYVYSNIGDYQINIPALTSDEFFVEDNEATKQYRINRKNRDAVLLTYSKVLIPKHDGEINLGTPSVSADVAVGRTRSRDPFDNFFGSSVQYKRFLVSAVPLKLSVLPLPGQDKPPGFYGLVGRYMISAAASPAKVSVGDPITLTIKIGGDYLKPIQWPELEQISGLTENFKMPSQKSPPAVENGLKVFTQTIRPANDKITEIPSIPLSYFDAEKGQYVTAKTDPIKLEVSPARILTTADVEGRDFSPVSKEVEAVKKGISANYEGPDCLTNTGFSLMAAITTPIYLAGWLAPIAILLTTFLAKSIVQTNPEMAARKRRRSAAANAIKQLKNMELQIQNHPELLAELMKQYIGQRFDKVAGSLTAEDCRQVIISSTEDCQSANQFRDIISDCEASRYSSVTRQFDNETINNVSQLIRTIDKKSKL